MSVTVNSLEDARRLADPELSAAMAANFEGRIDFADSFEVYVVKDEVRGDVSGAGLYVLATKGEKAYLARPLLTDLGYTLKNAMLIDTVANSVVRSLKDGLTR